MLGKGISNNIIIKDLISKDSTSTTKQYMTTCRNYYHNKPEILQRRQVYYVDGNPVEDTTKSNHRLVNNFFKLLVDQKMGYLVGNPINLTSYSKNEKIIDDIYNVLGEKWDDVICELVKNVSIQGQYWMHPYINSEGEFDYQIVDSRQIIPIFDTAYETKLLALIRYYPIQIVDERGREVSRYKVEYWDSEKCTYYIEDKDGDYVLDDTESPNPCYHWYSYNTANASELKAHSWGRVPWIQFKNNEECSSDLDTIKSLQDDFDLNMSDFSNSLADIQEVVTAVMGYDGQDLAEFIKDLKVRKAVKVGEGGDIKTIKQEIPFEARKEHLNNLKELIFMFGQGVDFSTDRFGNSPSGIALRFLFAALDLKCDVLERKLKTSLREFFWFVCKYLGKYDYKDIKITFKRNTMVNESEIIDNCVKSQGIVSQKTIVEKHPWIEDPELELEALKEEKLDQIPVI